MFTLSLNWCGTTQFTTTDFDTLADAQHSLGQFARDHGLDVQGDGRMTGSLTTRTGRVNQATYSWSIRATR